MVWRFDIMNIDLTRLNNGLDEYIDIDVSYSFNEEELKNTGILKLDNVTAIGSIFKEYDELVIDLKIDGLMVLPCSVTLKPVNYSFTIEINENLGEIVEETSKKMVNSIDILPIIWENILMEVPLRVVSSDLEDLKLEGEGWKLITEED